jgi:uncharacterized protein (TIGR02145 family)
MFAAVFAGCGGGGGNNTVGNNCTGAGTCKTVSIGGHVWLSENLSIQTADSWCYGEGGQVYDLYDYNQDNYVTISSSEVQANCAKYGRLYTYAAAKSACELLGSGWHLPSREEWQELVRAVDPNAELINGWDYGNVAGKYLKSETGWNAYSGIENLDTYGFSALPGGSRDSDGYFDYAGGNGLWWTATEYGSSDAYYRNMYYHSDYVDENYYGKGLGFSVRCRGD